MFQRFSAGKCDEFARIIRIHQISTYHVKYFGIKMKMSHKHFLKCISQKFAQQNILLKILNPSKLDPPTYYTCTCIYRIGSWEMAYKFLKYLFLELVHVIIDPAQQEVKHLSEYKKCSCA